MLEFKVKDIGLAENGRKVIEWAKLQMPVLLKIKEEFEKTKPLKNLTIACCLHCTKETAVLVETLKAGGAKVALCGSNPLSTQDEVVAALAQDGINVFAWKGETREEYYWCIDQVLSFKPNITIDDGADLINTLHTRKRELIENVIGGQEETTTGVIRLKALAREGELKYPVIAVNDTPTKRMFDNVYGTGQSTIDGIIRATNVLLAGKCVVIVGYGYCGSGIARRARGMDAEVIVVEVDPVKALKATMDGFRVMPMREAARFGDIFITATGCKDAIAKDHLKLMKDKVILANAGHFDVEISIPDLEEISVSKKRIKEYVDEYTTKDGKRIYLLAEGRLVNLVVAEGHPSAVMDLSFANQALCCEYLVKNRGKLEKKVYDVPTEIDEKIARLKLKTLGIEIDSLTEEQKKYIESWKIGT